MEQDSNQPSPLRLRGLTVNKYRNVKPGTHVEFSDGTNVLVGRNATGKTTFLELIFCCFQQGLPWCPEEQWDAELDVTLHANQAQLRMKREAKQSNDLADTNLPLSPSLRPVVVDSAVLTTNIGGEQCLLERNPETGRSTLTRNAQVVMDKPSISAGPGTFQQWMNVIRTIPEGDEVLVTLAASALELGSLFTVFRFDESQETFSAIVSEPRLAGDVLLSPYVQHTLTVSEGKHDEGWTAAPVPEYLAQSLLKDFQPSKNHDPLVFTHSSLRFLREFVGLCGYKEASLVIPQSDIKKEGDSEIATYRPFEFRFGRRDGSIIRHQHLTYGQKRLLAFLYYLDTNESIVLADELVNGFHHSWIEHCMERLRGRQAFLTSQNPLLLDYLSFATAEEVRRTFILCDIEQVGDQEWVTWRNMTEAQAHEFFEAYKVGIQYVSEILRTHGLW